MYTTHYIGRIYWKVSWPRFLNDNRNLTSKTTHCILSTWCILMYFTLLSKTAQLTKTTDLCSRKETGLC